MNRIEELNLAFNEDILKSKIVDTVKDLELKAELGVNKIWKSVVKSLGIRSTVVLSMVKIMIGQLIQAGVI